MAKNEVNQEELSIVSVEEMTDTALGFLGDTFAQEETPQESFQMARLAIYQSGKKYTDKGVNTGFVVDYNRGEEIRNVNTMRLSLIDGPIPARVMWAYDASTGKRLTGEDSNSPACASSNGVAPRQGDRFSYVGTTFEDPRTHENHTIVADCANCPLGKWLPQADEHGHPMYVTLPNGKMVQKNGQPPCQETPVFVFWDHDTNEPVIFQASSVTVRTFVMGAGSRSKYGVIKSVKSYYERGRGQFPPVMPDGRNIYPLVFKTKAVRIEAYNSFVNVPDISLSQNALTAEEVLAYANAKNDYVVNNVRERLTGDYYFQDDDQEYVTVTDSADTPF